MQPESCYKTDPFGEGSSTHSLSLVMRGPLIAGALLAHFLPVTSQSIGDVVRRTAHLVLRFCRLTTRILVANNVG